MQSRERSQSVRNSAKETLFYFAKLNQAHHYRRRYITVLTPGERILSKVVFCIGIEQKFLDLRPDSVPPPPQ